MVNGVTVMLENICLDVMVVGRVFVCVVVEILANGW